jgi:hypothetical protein
LTKTTATATAKTTPSTVHDKNKPPKMSTSKNSTMDKTMTKEQEQEQESLRKMSSSIHICENEIQLPEHNNAQQGTTTQGKYFFIYSTITNHHQPSPTINLYYYLLLQHTVLHVTFYHLFDSS